MKLLFIQLWMNSKRCSQTTALRDAAAGADTAIDIDHRLHTRQVRRKRAPVHAPLMRASCARGCIGCFDLRSAANALQSVHRTPVRGTERRVAPTPRERVRVSLAAHIGYHKNCKAHKRCVGANGRVGRAVLLSVVEDRSQLTNYLLGLAVGPVLARDVLRSFDKPSL